MFSESFFTESYFPHSYFSHAFSGASFEALSNISEEIRGDKMLKVHKINVDWISSSAGDLVASLPKAYGFLIKMVVIPGSVLSPSLGYDIEVLGEDGIDVLGGLGHDMDSVNTITIYPSFNGWLTPAMSTGDQNILIQNAGSGRVGSVRLYYVESLGKKNVA